MKISGEIDLLIQEYERRYSAGDISRNTLKCAANSLEKLKKFWGPLDCEKITKERWAKFQMLFDKNIGENQFNLTKHMTVLVGHLYEKGLLKTKIQIRNQFSRRERDARRKKKNWLFTNDEVKALDAAAIDDKERLALRLGYLLAFRISDVVQLTWERIILDGKVAYVEFSGEDDKAGFVGRCPLPGALVEMLLRLPKTSKWVFPQARDQTKHLLTQQIDFNAIKTRAGIKKGGFHDLRRYRLSLDFKNPKLTPALVCKMRRISLPVAMENYIRTNENDLELMLKESK